MFVRDAARRKCFSDSLSRVLVLSTCAVLISGCVTQSETRTVSRISIDKDGRTTIDSTSTGTRGDTETKYIFGKTIDEFIPKRINLAKPVDGVFIGVSNFGEQARKIPTPAHAIGAAFAYSLFFNAARRTPSDNNGGINTIGGVAVIGSSRVELRADLRLDPIDPTWKARDVASLLDRLGVGVYPYSPVFSLPHDRLWPYIQSEEPLNKANILQLAREQARRLSLKGEKERPVGVFYLATHGRLGSNGARYALAADSVADDISTWISYQEIVDIFKNVFNPYLPVSVIVLFDTCLSGDVPESGAQALSPPEGMMVLAAAAPGEYSWHWTQITEIELVKATSGMGIFKREAAAADLSYYSTVSVMPVAAGHALRQMEAECALNPTNALEGITSVDFVRALGFLVPELAKRRTGSVTALQTAELFLGRVTATHVQFDLPVSPERYVLFALNCVDPAAIKKELE